jgi:hypothetical protein
MRHKHTLFPRRAVSKIILIPKAAKMLVLSGELGLGERPCKADSGQTGQCML